MDRMYSIMDIFVLSSFWELLGNVSLEAMAFGKPIVATRVGGIPEVVREGENAILVEPDSPEYLASAIGKLLNNSDLVDRFREKSKEVVKDFTWDAIAEKYIDIYSLVIKCEKGEDNTRRRDEHTAFKIYQNK